MKIFMDISLEEFEAWNGGEDTLEVLRSKDLCDRLENIIESDIFPDGCTDDELNDLLWFERDAIAQWLGFANWELLDRDEECDDDDENELDFELLNSYIENNSCFEDYCDSAVCDGKCPFSCCSCQSNCEKAYCLMLSGYDFEAAITNLTSFN